MPPLPPIFLDILSHFTPRSAIDILIVAALLFWLLLSLRGTTAITLLRGIALVYGLGFLVSTIFQLTVISWLLRNSLPAMLVAVPILFQPEIRRVLEQMGRGVLWRPDLNSPNVLQTVGVVAESARVISERTIGALIVLERETGLQEYIDRGVPLDAVLSADFLTGIFSPTSPFHDGAVIIRRGRIAACRCVMPLSESIEDSMGLGLRHRAALGISERTDAIALAISEERGTISLAVNGRLLTLLDGDHLPAMLMRYYATQPSQTGKSPDALTEAADG